MIMVGLTPQVPGYKKRNLAPAFAGAFPQR